MKIVLASASPRRHELLKLAVKEFEIRVSDVDENVPENISADKHAQYLSALKAGAVGRADDELIIGCDTVVSAEGKVLGKPSSAEECFEMLSFLSGKKHMVYTGVTFIYKDSVHSFTSETEVKFYPLNEKEINNYISTGEPFDKAGGYGIQGQGALLVREIRGDYFNVVGLPVSRLSRELDKFIGKQK